MASDEEAEAQAVVAVAVATEAGAGLDLLLAALSAAASHYRRASVCTPFPVALFEPGGMRDYGALAQCLSSLPSMAQLAEPAALRRLDRPALELLAWLAGHPRRAASSIRRVSLEDVRTSLPGLKGWVADLSYNPSLRPTAVLQLAPVPGPQVLAHQTLAWHGTSMENVHSVLHTGLLNLSGTRLERTGAAFGKGIYLTSELTVAFTFCQPAAVGWRGSELGTRLRCVLLCGIQSEHAQHGGAGGTVPDKYIVVERSDVVSLYYAFVYADEASAAASPADAAARGPAVQQAAARQPWQWQRFLLRKIVWSYLVFLTYQWLQANWPWVKRWLRRQGVRL
eukprot:scaffold30.g4433.t1